MLFIDDMIPLRRLGSGFVRSNDLIQVMATLGYRVTVYPINPTRGGLATIYADMPDTVEVMHDRSREELADFVAARARLLRYDLDRAHAQPRARQADAGTRCRRHGEAAAHRAGHRGDRHAARGRACALAGAAPFDVDAAIMQEFAGAHVCQSHHRGDVGRGAEAARSRLPGVAVIGHWREARRPARVRRPRRHAVPRRDSSTGKSELRCPGVVRARGSAAGGTVAGAGETRLTIAGFVDLAVTLEAYREHPRITLCGAVEDVAPLYDAHRIFIAPTRYAAGVPYKVHEAAAYGLPVVASELLCRQLGWRDGCELIAASTADPAEFARRIVALYRDAALWQTLRDNALERVRAEHGRAQYRGCGAASAGGVKL